MKRKYIYFGTAVLFCLVRVLSLGKGQEYYLSEGILVSCFGRFEINTASLMEIFKNMVPFVVFQLIAGTKIHSDFCSAGVYCFYRSPDRSRWFHKELLGLLLDCFVFQAVYFAVSLFFMWMVCGISYDEGSLKLLFLSFMVFLCWNYLACVLMNMISVLSSSMAGSSVVCGIQFFFISLFFICGMGGPFSIYEEETRATGVKLLQFNPASRLIINWYEYGDGSVLSFEASLLGLGFIKTIITAVLLTIPVILIFKRTIKRLELYGDMKG